MSRSNESRPRTAIPRAFRFALTALVAITALSISACESPFADKEQKPTPTPTFNVFSTPTPRPGDGEIQALLGADFSMPDAGFFVRFPGEWTLDTDDPAGFEVVFRSREPDRDQTGQAFAAISVATDVPAGYAPVRGRRFFDTTLEEGLAVLQSLDDFQLVQSWIQLLPAGDAAVFEYSYSAPSAGRLHSLQYVVPGDTRVFLITLTSLDSVWSRYAKTFEVTMATFTVLAGK